MAFKRIASHSRVRILKKVSTPACYTLSIQLNNKQLLYGIEIETGGSKKRNRSHFSTAQIRSITVPIDWKMSTWCVYFPCIFLEF